MDKVEIVKPVSTYTKETIRCYTRVTVVRSVSAKTWKLLTLSQKL